MSFNAADYRRRMDSTLQNVKEEFAGLRTGRASASMLDPVTVEAYGSRMPLNQVGTVNVPEPRMLSVQIWDQTLVKPTEKAIRDSGLGLNPITEGNTIRVPIPQLTEDRRKELGKVAGKYAEAARVAIRNVRRDGMDLLKKLEKDKTITEDDQKKKSDEIQKMTDESIKKVDTMLADKEKDIMVI